MRTSTFVTAIFACLVFVSPSWASAAIVDREWNFTAYLDGKPIGYHRFSLKRQGERASLSSRASFDVKFLFFNAYRYRHRANEAWEGGCLREFSSTTDDNGRQYRVVGRKAGQDFLLSSAGSQSSLPDCVMTFAYWNPAFLKQPVLLNSQNGSYVPVQVTERGREAITAKGREYIATRYELSAEKLNISLWYSDAGDWLALESVTESGRVLRYRLDQ
ncbi:DUF6134 family protein [Biformimicrobium ophioploci]|uniref:DUF3108 domain-containing protein n=1 Tax=Biformimicrobium ophioploci TaxID=3036711 RepID=A0ABQ6LYT2_9GAMM|nr:DUF6134 family protein [Microbulbifer sp. NKW57]GMG87246.1 hypothetical protein MNKW57_15670 [Microbulbifer sp. NKW57]